MTDQFLTEATWIMGRRSRSSRPIRDTGGPKQVGYIQRQPGSWEGGPDHPQIMDDSGPEKLGDTPRLLFPIQAFLFFGAEKWF
ncbi:unnamed protein product [Clonostachys rhizophaga]|uniref:Uncharacterized protein n=1 Tax=Clonostachys rhizophaga TaxID=160324 RepID=A0A9N9VEV9_9HYPO|nr:unnamed protein product [Clonostachys rhizophaga]